LQQTVEYLQQTVGYLQQTVEYLQQTVRYLQQKTGKEKYNRITLKYFLGWWKQTPSAQLAEIKLLLFTTNQ